MKEYKYTINGNVYQVKINEIEENIADVEVNGTSYKVEMEKKPEEMVRPRPVVRPAAPAASNGASSSAAQRPAAGGNGVKSPLPGVILELKVNVGDAVKKGDIVLILEAMKMENNINADRDGKVTAINVKPGDSVLEGTVLVVIE